MRRTEEPSFVNAGYGGDDRLGVCCFAGYKDSCRVVSVPHMHNFVHLIEFYCMRSVA